MMRKLYLFILSVSVFTTSVVRAQEIENTQWYLNLPGVNPGFTGAEEYLDARFSFRQGWNNIITKNESLFASAYGTFGKATRGALSNNTLRLSDQSEMMGAPVRKKINRKHGVGGMLSQRNFGPYSATTVTANYAYHIPISAQASMAFGTRIGYAAQRISLDGLTVRDDVNDAFYNQIMNSKQGNSSNFLVDFGYTIYSPKFFVGVSTSNLVSSVVSGDGVTEIGRKLQLTAQAALTSVTLGENFSMSPSARFVYADGYDPFWNATLRVRYRDIVYAGAGYTNSTPRLSLLFGLNVSKTLHINYSYDRYLAGLSNFNVRAHEIVVGVVLFNKYGLSPKFW